MKKEIINIILRKEKENNKPIIFYRDSIFKNSIMSLAYSHYFYKDIYSHCNCDLSYYYNDTKKITLKECKKILKKLFGKEKYKVYQKLNFKNYERILLQ